MRQFSTLSASAAARGQIKGRHTAPGAPFPIASATWRELPAAFTSGAISAGVSSFGFCFRRHILQYVRDLDALPDRKSDSAKRDLARIKEEISGSRSTKRRQLLTRAANEEELAVAAEEKSVAQSKEGDAILKREKHEAGCD